MALRLAASTRGAPQHDGLGATLCLTNHAAGGVGMRLVPNFTTASDPASRVQSDGPVNSWPTASLYGPGGGSSWFSIQRMNHSRALWVHRYPPIARAAALMVSYTT